MHKLPSGSVLFASRIAGPRRAHDERDRHSAFVALFEGAASDMQRFLMRSKRILALKTAQKAVISGKKRRFSGPSVAYLVHE